MTNNSKIFLKGEKEPLVVNEKTARQVNEIFNNSAVEQDRKINLGSISFLKSNIKMVVVKRDTDETKHNEKRKGYILFNTDTRSVYMGDRQSAIFDTYDQAKNELDFMQLNSKTKINYRIEETAY